RRSLSRWATFEPTPSTRRQPIRILLAAKQRRTVERRRIACHDRIDDCLAKRPKAPFGLEFHAKPAPPPAAALVLPEFQSLTTQFVEHQANVANKGVADDGGVGGTKRCRRSNLHEQASCERQPTLRRECDRGAIWYN